MTCRLPTPWYLPREANAAGTAAGSVEPTATLDWGSPAVAALVDEVELSAAGGERTLLLEAHRLIAARVRPVYALDEAQPASRTLERGRGSCSQRFAVLEAVARGAGIPTRVRGLLVDGRFWYPRFPHLRFAVPDAVLLAWPEFRLEGGWVSASSLFASPESGGGGFTNAGGETLFDAVTRTAVDWDGATSAPGTCSTCDLSAKVLRDLGRFDSRDELFARHGQTLCWPARLVGEPVLGRWSAASARPTA